jgi:hypothetical protein
VTVDDSASAQTRCGAWLASVTPTGRQCVGQGEKA